MFAYCENNPVFTVDPSGHFYASVNEYQELLDIDQNGIPDYLDRRWVAITEKNKKQYYPDQAKRDVTEEVDNALTSYMYSALLVRKMGEKLSVLAMYKYSSFYELVNHNATWDIKRETRWEETIGTPFPGVGEIVVYRNVYVTPEALGNYIYGMLGRAYGFSMEELLIGSAYAAGFPTEGPGFDNEMQDWSYITMGFFTPW